MSDYVKMARLDNDQREMAQDTLLGNGWKIQRGYTNTGPQQRTPTHYELVDQNGVHLANGLAEDDLLLYAYELALKSPVQFWPDDAFKQYADLYAAAQSLPANVRYQNGRYPNPARQKKIEQLGKLEAKFSAEGMRMSSKQRHALAQRLAEIPDAPDIDRRNIRLDAPRPSEVQFFEGEAAKNIFRR